MIHQMDCIISETDIHENVDINMIDAVHTNSDNQPNTIDFGEANYLPLLGMLLT